MLVTTTENLPGYTVIKTLGLCMGNVTRAKHIGRDIMAGLKTIVGGELKGYTELLSEARQQALDRMLEQAAGYGANAVVNVRFATSMIAQGSAEMLAYGTAVVVEELP